MAVAVAVAVSGGVAVPVPVPVAGITKRFFNQKDFLINVWGYGLNDQVLLELFCTLSYSLRGASGGIIVRPFKGINPKHRLRNLFD